MFRYFSFLFCLLCFGSLLAQNNKNITGTVTDAATSQPLPDAYLSLKANNVLVQRTLTDSRGKFSFTGVAPGIYMLEVSRVGYERAAVAVSLTETTTPGPVLVVLTEVVTESQEVVVEAFRASSQTPVTQSNLTQKEIEAQYVGKDIPMLISYTPSINSYSESGSGMGYTYFRLRGIDQTRINMTVNGVPVNDAETQGFFTNNFADLASSAEQIQVQRGVGTSSNGTAAFGGSLNIVTRNLAETPSFMLHSGYGSFNSRRNTVEYQTGRLAGGKVAFYGRLSDLASDGYREHSATRNQSYFVSGALFGKKSVLKLNAWGGVSQSQLAYVGIDSATLKNNRRANPLLPEERDEFRQNFYQLQYTYHFNSRWNVAASAYYVKGTAPYFDVRFYGFPYAYANMPDTLFRGGDTITTTDYTGRYRLDQQYTGGFASLNYKADRLAMSFGAHASRFVSDHYMQVPWMKDLPEGFGPEHRAYFNTGTKQDMSAFVKASYRVGSRLTLFADVQVRRATWEYKAQPTQYLFTDYKVEPMAWIFVNPKIGARYQLTAPVAFYLNAGMAGREPTRMDYLRDDLAWRDVKQDDVKPETVYDIEVGTDINTQKLALRANLFYMDFENQIANTGFINSFGAAINQNTGSGHRAGIEIEGVYNITPRVALTHASSFSDNAINSFTQYYNVYDEAGNATGSTSVTYKNTSPALTPAIIVNQGVRYRVLPMLSIEATGRYVDKQYIDNTGTESLSLPSYFVLDASVQLKLEQWTKVGEQTLKVHVFNATNTLYSPSGTIGGYSNNLLQDAQGNRRVITPAAYFPAAPINFFVTLSMKF